MRSIYMRNIHKNIKQKAFGSRRMLAVAAAIAIGMCFTVPAEVYATQTADTDTVDDEFEDGDQETVANPDAGTDTSSTNTGSGSGSSSGTSSSQNTGSGSSGSSSGTSSSSGSRTSGTTASRSSDSSLAHLGISPGTISPAFSAGTHEYTATVDANVTAISVAARPNDSKAVIASVTGAKTLSPGTNTVKVVVSAENGTTTTYTITVTCGSASASSSDTTADASTDQAADTSDVVEGEITDSTADTPADETAEGDAAAEDTSVTFDDNGYLIYEGNAYIPSSMMPEGEYVSLDKYNKLYEQTQAQKTKYTRLVIILAVLLLAACIAILNLALKLRDVKQDARLGLDEPDDEDEDRHVRSAGRERRSEKKSDKKSDRYPEKTPENKKVHKRAESSVAEPQTDMIPDLKLPESMVAAKPEKKTVFHKKKQDNDDLEILDLNDL